MAGTYQNGHLIVGTVYRVVRHIGAGGMGSLYEVEDTTVGRHYVFKTLHPEMIERADIALRMQQEARALGRLSHPNIVQVITAGVTGDALKVPFYVMEKLDGLNLRTVIDARRGHGGVGFSNAYSICIDVLSALQHAHDNAMVHRDVKPDNIFLHKGPDGKTVTKLVDFGIVRMLNREASLTRGKFLGTLKYSSPEQITGLREIGPASDVYSMGLVLYEMLVGRGPFDDVGDGFKIGAAHAGTPPPPPSQFHLIAPEVEKLILRALEKQPEARLSPGAFAEGLRQALHKLKSTPNVTTDVDLLIQHPIEVGAQVPTRTENPASATITSNTPSSTVPNGPPIPAAVTRLEGAGRVAVADTLAAGGGGPATPVMAAPAPAPAPHGGLDRNAPTRITPPSQPGIRAPSNDTQVASSPRIATMKMDNAPARGLVAPATGLPAQGQGQGNGSVVPASGAPISDDQRRYLTTVQTRPRKDRTIVAIVIAAGFALAMIAGAFVLVRGRLTTK